MAEHDFFSQSVLRYRQALAQLGVMRTLFFEKSGVTLHTAAILCALAEVPGRTFRELSHKTGIPITEVPACCKAMAEVGLISLKRKKNGFSYNAYLTKDGKKKHAKVIIVG